MRAHSGTAHKNPQVLDSRVPRELVCSSVFLLHHLAVAAALSQMMILSSLEVMTHAALAHHEKSLSSRTAAYSCLPFSLTHSITLYSIRLTRITTHTLSLSHQHHSLDTHLYITITILSLIALL